MTPVPRFHPWVHRLAVLVAAWTLFMIVAGGMVTSQDAGDSVPDWPLSYGTLFPKMVGNVFWEHGHRLVGMALGLLTLLLSVLILHREVRPRVRLLGWLAFPAVCVQGALGGFRVKIISSHWLQDLLFSDPTGAAVEKLRVVVAIVHTATAQMIFCLMVAIALVTSWQWLSIRSRRRAPGCLHCGYDLTGSVDDPMICPECGRTTALHAPFVSPLARKLRGIAIATAIIIFIQILLGAHRRQTDGTIWYHAVGAGLVVLHVGLLARRALSGFSQVPPITAAAIGLLLLAAGQIVLGAGSWLLTYQALVQRWHLPQIRGSAEAASAVLTAHLALGALILALCVTLILRSFHHVQGEPQAAPGDVPVASASAAGRSGERGIAL